MKEINTQPAPTILTLVLLLACMAAIAATLYVGWLHDRVRASEALAKSITDGLTRCAPPGMAGDRTVITVLHTGGRLAITCHTTPHFFQPERITP
jgi:hypothetical protein